MFLALYHLKSRQLKVFVDSSVTVLVSKALLLLSGILSMPELIHMCPNLYDALVIGTLRESIGTFYTMNKPNI